MIAADLKQKWDTLEAIPESSDFDLFRASAECRPELSVAITPNGERGLVLSLPPEHNIDFREIELEKLCLKKVPEDNFLLVVLLDPSFRQLFDDLVVSMHNAIHDIEDVDTYSKVFLKTFAKWEKFFERHSNSLLPENIVRGMFGELVVLRKLLSEAKAEDVNVILNSWKGPYDKSQDFVFEQLNIEVKTRTPGSASIKIANEIQLDQADGKDLQLAVVCLDAQSEMGLTLLELTREVINIIENMLGDTSILYKALGQKNLGPTNLSDYDIYRYFPTEIANFDCSADTFPRLVRSTLPTAVFGVRYSINTDELDEFLIGKTVP